MENIPSYCNCKILIIDDDNDFSEATKIILGSRNYEVISADNTKDGLLLLENENPDLLILDVMMENKAAGFIISRKVRKNPKFKKLPILMLTGMRERTGFFFPGEPKNDIFLPANEFLEKPTPPEILLEKIVRIFIQKQYQLSYIYGLGKLKLSLK